jgi:pimeloyl-ACP methyl ester carboxylesterase
LGGAVALQLAIRHPASVRKLVVVSSASARDGMTAEMSELFRTMTPEMFKGTPMEEEYKRLAPDPDGFETLIWKLKELVATNRDWSEDVRTIAAPVLVIAGDSDIVRLDHIVQLFQSLPDAQLAVLPGTTHFDPGSRVLDRPALLDAMIRPFLEAQ